MRVKSEKVPDGVGVRCSVGTRGGFLQPDGRVMQKLVDDLNGDGLDGAVLLRRQVGKPPPRPLELAEADFLSPRP
jgi:hypothetical protein